MESFAAEPRLSRRALWQLTALLLVIVLLIPAQIFANEGGRGHRIRHIIVVYLENWSFDSLYGLFPRANGLSRSSLVSLTQRDRLSGQAYSSQLGNPFDLVSGALPLT